MVRSLLKDVVWSVLGFLVVPYRFFKSPLNLHRVALSNEGFGLALSLLAWVLVLEISISSHLLGVIQVVPQEWRAAQEAEDGITVVLDYAEEAPTLPEPPIGIFYSVLSAPIVGEVAVVGRILIVLLAAVPSALILIKHRLDEKIFRQFMTLTMLIVGLANFVFLLLVVVIVFAVAHSGSYYQLSLLPITTRLPGVVLAPAMFVVSWISWGRLLPDVSLLRRITAFATWVMGMLLVGAFYKVASWGLASLGQ